MTITPIAFRDPPLLNASGVHEPWALRSIVEVHTDDGLVGIGETYGDDGHLSLLRRAGSLVVGADPWSTAVLYGLIRDGLGLVDAPDEHGLTGASSPAKTLARVFSPFEVACLDVQGRALGLPVHALLGGKVRDRVPFSAYLFYRWAAHPDSTSDGWPEALDPDGIVTQAKELVRRHGFGSLKLKGGVFPPAQEVAAVRALREAFPDHPLRLDPNAAWTVPTSLWVASSLEGTLEYLEDPTPGLEGMASVAASTPIPLATNMCVVGFADLPPAVRLGSVAVVLADHHFWGGLRQSQRLAGICETWGMGLSMHSNSHLGVSLAAMVHLAAATPNLDYACDTHLPWQTEDIVTSPLRFVDGAVTVPHGPGLGVELDRDALARLHEQYVHCGIRRRDDASYMRRFDPSYTPSRPRW